jgi:hypothetical protein
MKRINFERIEIFVDIDKTRCSVENYKKDFANIIYQLGRGIEAHASHLKYSTPMEKLSITMKSVI